MEKSPDLLEIDLSGATPVEADDADMSAPHEAGAARAIPLRAGAERLVKPSADANSPTELIEPGRSLALTDFTPPSMGAG